MIWGLIAAVMASVFGYMAYLRALLNKAESEKREAQINEIKTNAKTVSDSTDLSDLIIKLERIRSRERPPTKKK
jgi:hypothetical protein